VRAGPIHQIIGAADASSIEAAAAKGDAVAQFQLAMDKLDRGQDAQAAGLLKRAADQGLAMAQYRLAKAYERGQGVARDAQASRRLIEQAAQAGNAKAMHDLGVLMAEGRNATLNEPAAFNWFRQAAELSVSQSQYNLGILYLQGRGVTADPALAYFWLEVAAAGGDQAAGARAAMLERTLGPVAADIRGSAHAFTPKHGQAFANGEFGDQPWEGLRQASAAEAPRS
jgi:localization factor PodJL